MSIHSRNKGFTLIELLVVMVILGVTSSLVAPDMFSIVKRSQARTELAKIKAIADLSIERSFFSASKLKIVFKDNAVVFSQFEEGTGLEGKVLKTIKSDFFTFEESHVVINKGHWQGNHLVKVSKSPNDKLKEFILFDKNDASKTIANSNDTNEEVLNKAENSQLEYSDVINGDVEDSN